MDNTSLFKKAVKKGLKVLYFDGEMSPHVLYGYGLFNQNFTVEQIKEPGKVTSVAYMSEHDRKPYALGWEFDHETGQGDDTELLAWMSSILNDADLIIGQNSDAFDLKWIQWRLNIHKLPPLNLDKYVTLDTLKLSRKVFKAPSQKLDYRSTVYGFGGKITQHWDDIIKVTEGDEKAQNLRIKYNIKDVLDTRKVFLRELDYYVLPKKILKFFEDKAKDDKVACPKCARSRQKRFDVTALANGKYECNNCELQFKVKKRS